MKISLQVSDSGWREVDRLYAFAEQVNNDETWAKVSRFLRSAITQACVIEEQEATDKEACNEVPVHS